MSNNANITRDLKDLIAKLVVVFIILLVTCYKTEPPEKNGEDESNDNKKKLAINKAGKTMQKFQILSL